MSASNAVDYLEPDYCPALLSGAFTITLGQEAIVWSEVGPGPIYLEPAAALLVSVFDGVATNADLVEDLSDVLGIETDIARSNLWKVLLALAQGQVLDYPSRPVEHQLSLHHSLPEPNW